MNYNDIDLTVIIGSKQTNCGCFDIYAMLSHNLHTTGAGRA